MDYFDRMKNLSREMADLCESTVDLGVLKHKSISFSPNTVSRIDEYNRKIKNLEAKMDKLRKQILDASFLDFEMMGSAMANIVSVFEQKRYEFYNTYINELSSGEEVCETKYFVAPCTLNKFGLDWDFLVNSVDILLFNNDNYNKKVRFVNYVGSKEIKVLDYGKFSYLDDFVKYVINYKLNYNIDINRNNIEEIADEFLELKKEEIDKRSKGTNKLVLI